MCCAWIVRELQSLDGHIIHQSGRKSALRGTGLAAGPPLFLLCICSLEKGSTLQCGSRVPWILDQVHILLSHGIPASKATAATSPNSLMDTHRPREAEGYCGTKEGNKTRGTQVNVYSWCIGRCHNGHQSASTNCPRSPCQPKGLTFSLSHVTLSLRPP